MFPPSIHLDLRDSFFQLRVQHSEKSKLTICHRGNFFRYKRLPQGISTASAFLSLAIFRALSRPLNGKVIYHKNVLAYLDDIIAYDFGNTVEDHIVV